MMRVLDPTGHQKDTVARMVLAGSGMQVGRRMGGMMGKNLAVRGR